MALVHSSPGMVEALFDSHAIVAVIVKDSRCEDDDAASEAPTVPPCQEFTVRFWSGKSWRRVTVEAKAFVAPSSAAATSEASTAPSCQE